MKKSSGTLSVKNYDEFQHYKDRTPPWIKLYNSLLEDYEFNALPDVAKSHLMLVWLLASRSKNQIPYDPKWVANKIGANSKVDLELLVEAGFLIEGGVANETADWGSRYINKETKDLVWERDGGKCQSCGLRKRIEYDHIQPVSQGGLSDPDNLQLLCASCNRKKRVRSTRYTDAQPCVQSYPDRRSLEESRGEESREDYVSKDTFVNGEAADTKSIPVKLAFEHYNIAAKELGLPVAQTLTADRRRKLRARLVEHGLDNWDAALIEIEKSEFLRGGGNTGWRASLDFLLQPSSFNKVLEGGYSDEH